MNRLICVLILLLLAPAPLFAEETVIRVRPPQGPDDASHDYYLKLLQLALDKTCAKYGPASIKVTNFNVAQGRALMELGSGGAINVDWAGTNRQREQDLLPVRIPLIGGLLGYRVPVICKKFTADFSKIRSLADLRKYTAVQGSHWPDSDILEHAGLKVYRVPNFSFMYDMVQKCRVDYFPRGVNEVYAEQTQVADRGLVAFDSLLIAYPLPMYFFTSRADGPLAKRIETGLREAIKDGSFLELMKNHPVTAPLFPLSKYDDAVILHLENPFLPKQTPLQDATLWLRLGRDARP
ncbi:hypothetical protein [Salidesulfovibrio onnuriiensis]|uniref:hypothetical protein n=1 Tax=Salidesulfovibrio onnuriiensis TaxID=2583823 RepID=UPI0011C8EAA3|nr:hypothetical protein [Salidesulfovibrio onnuriiensis]